MATQITFVQAVFEAIKDMPIKNDYYSVNRIRDKLHRLYPNSNHILHMTDKQLSRSLSYLYTRKVIDRRGIRDKEGSHLGYEYKLLDENAVFGGQGMHLKFKHPVSSIHKAFGSAILKDLVQLMEVNKIYSSTTLVQMLKDHTGIQHPLPSIISALESSQSSTNFRTKKALEKLGVEIEMLGRNGIDPAIIHDIPNSYKHKKFFRIVPSKKTQVKGDEIIVTGKEPVDKEQVFEIKQPPTDKTPLIEKVQFVIEVLEEVKAELKAHQNATKKLKELTELLNASTIE